MNIVDADRILAAIRALETEGSASAECRIFAGKVKKILRDAAMATMPDNEVYAEIKRLTKENSRLEQVIRRISAEAPKIYVRWDGNPTRPAEMISGPEQFAAEMLRMSGDDNRISRHYDMDSHMCKVLCQLGYGEGVEIFQKTNKGYA